MSDYELKELTKQEGEALTKDLQDVLAKHGCEMGVVSNIQLLKRVAKSESTVSPIQIENGNDSTEKAS